MIKKHLHKEALDSILSDKEGMFRAKMRIAQTRTKLQQIDEGKAKAKSAASVGIMQWVKTLKYKKIPCIQYTSIHSFSTVF